MSQRPHHTRRDRGRFSVLTVGSECLDQTAPSGLDRDCVVGDACLPSAVCKLVLRFGWCCDNKLQLWPTVDPDGFLLRISCVSNSECVAPAKRTRGHGGRVMELKPPPKTLKVFEAVYIIIQKENRIDKFSIFLVLFLLFFYLALPTTHKLTYSWLHEEWEYNVFLFILIMAF